MPSTVTRRCRYWYNIMVLMITRGRVFLWVPLKNCRSNCLQKEVSAKVQRLRRPNSLKMKIVLRADSKRLLWAARCLRKRGGKRGLSSSLRSKSWRRLCQLSVNTTWNDLETLFNQHSLCIRCQNLSRLI